MQETIKRICNKNSNCYLILDENKQTALLVDTGSENDRKLIDENLKGIKLKGIILTHGHVDHVANAKCFSKKYKCPVFISKNDEILLSNNLARYIYSETFFGGIIKNISCEMMKKTILRKPKNIQYITDGDTFADLGFGNIKIVNLSGHTRGSIGVLCNKKELIVGDTLVNYIKPSIAVMYEEKGSLVNSIEYIKDLMPQRIYPGHGKIFNYQDYFKMEKIRRQKMNQVIRK